MLVPDFGLSRAPAPLPMLRSASFQETKTHPQDLNVKPAPSHQHSTCSKDLLVASRWEGTTRPTTAKAFAHAVGAPRQLVAFSLPLGPIAPNSQGSAFCWALCHILISRDLPAETHRGKKSAPCRQPSTRRRRRHRWRRRRGTPRRRGRPKRCMASPSWMPQSSTRLHCILQLGFCCSFLLLSVGAARPYGYLREASGFRETKPTAIHVRALPLASAR